jgi:uncharacterized oligopeptide transporter (OPT) family protein
LNHDENAQDLADRRWLAEVYQGDNVRQLTVRAVVTGMTIGAVMSISNLYVGLKTGWGLGVTITASIIAYAVFKSLETIVPAYRRNPFSILENCAMTSAASAAGYIASAGLVSSIPALYLTTGRVLAWWEMMLWLGAICTLGVFMAVPVKRQLINIDQLPFPTGTATAETLRSLHTTGGDAILKARALLGCASVAALFKLWKDGWSPFSTWLAGKFGSEGLGGAFGSLVLPDSLPLFPGEIGRTLLNRYTLGFEVSTLLMAAGAIMGIRVGVSLLIGGVFYYGILAPLLESGGLIVIDGARPFRSIVEWTLWPATAMMVASGLLSFALRWRTVLRALGSLATVFGRRAKADPLGHVEVPGSWFLGGVLVAGTATVILGQILFDIPWWMSILAVLITFVLAIVAARATGETDITPISAMGKITQLTFGAVAPANIPTNLMTASVTAGASSHCADLLTDLKAGYLLGANPRRQTIAQLFGVLAGVLLAVPIYTIVVKTPPRDVAGIRAGVVPGEETNLVTTEMPAPSAQVWASVAEMLAKGPNALPRGTVLAMIIGGLVGIALTLGDEYLPRRYSQWLPSSTGLGIAGIIPANNSVLMFLGALAAWLWGKWRRESADRYVVAGASGLIAGESLMGVTISIWLAAPAIAAGVWAFFAR